jgi:aryl-alcohol dehydrogenase-like predicted oxidoreductase
MEIYPFGNSSLKTTRLGLGLAAIGRPGYINLDHGSDLSGKTDLQSMYTNAIEVLNAAYNAGIRYFDAARSYGKSEEFLSQWIASNKNMKNLSIGSKWGYTYIANWKIDAEIHEVKEHSIENFMKQYPLSKKLLGDNLKIYHIHSATLESRVLENNEVLDALWKLKSEGIIIGLSLSGVKQNEVLEKALSIKTNTDLLFGSVQATWNILEQAATKTLKKAADLGLGIIIKEALANGRLSAKNQSSESGHYINTLRHMALEYKTSIDALSLAFVLDQSWANIVLSGVANMEQLHSNIRALDIQISQKDLKTLGELRQESELYWSDRAKLNWN